MRSCNATGGTIGVDVCLDECNGYYGTIPEDKYRYRYCSTGTYHEARRQRRGAPPPKQRDAYFPFMPPCIKGCVPLSLDAAGFTSSLTQPTPVCLADAEPGYSRT